MTMIKLEINALNADDLLVQIRGLQMGATVVTGGNAVVNVPAPEQDTKEEHERDASSYEAECVELQAKLEEATLAGQASEERNKTLSAEVKTITGKLKDAEASAEKSHKAFLEEQKRAETAESRVKDLETQLKTYSTKEPMATNTAISAKEASPSADNATNDTEADAALNEPAAAETVTAKAQPGARTNRTTRRVEKPVEETAEHKALRETITNDLLDLGGLAEKNAQVATDVEEILAKYGVTNGADLTIEQLEDAAADIAEIIKVYFRE